MGVIFSKLYGGKPSTRDTLEKIEQEIQNIEERRWDKIKREQFVVQILSFIPLTILIANVCLFVYPSESSLRDKFVLTIPVCILTLILWVCKKIVQWYSKWSLDNEEVRLRKLQKEKKRILELVCETESYKVATELLEKYDPKQLRRRERESERPTSPINKTLTKFTASPIRSPNQQRQQQQYQQHQHQSQLQPQIQTYPTSFLNQSVNLPALPVPKPTQTPNVKATPFKPELNETNTNLHNTSLASVAASSVQGRPVRPILSKDRSFFEKVVDWVVTDGPDNRFALICRYCYGHNGMSLAEEYETINFRCCYCYNLNTSTHKRQVHDQLQPEREKDDTSSKINDGVGENSQDMNDDNSKLEETSEEKTSERSKSKRKKEGSKQKIVQSVLSAERSTLVEDILEEAETTIDENSRLLDKSRGQEIDFKIPSVAEDKTEGASEVST